VAAVRWIKQNTNGRIALFVPAATQIEFSDLTAIRDPADTSVDAVVIGDLGEAWDYATLNRAFRLLMQDPKPVLIALGMTRYWKAPDGLRLDVAPFIIGLQHATGIEPMVLGKPAKTFFYMALDMLGGEPEESVMVGDDIRGDISGAQACNMRGLLVRSGKFQPSDLELGIKPDGIIDSIADLAGWWEANCA
jgi:HAD superfamily hydrolase (TIGR01458 family)